MNRLCSIALLLLAASCGPGLMGGSETIDTGLEGLELDAVDPGTMVPGTTLIVDGHSFVPDDFGQTRVHFFGDLDGAEVDVKLPAMFVDYDRLEVHWPGGVAAGLPGDQGVFSGQITVEVDSEVDHETHESNSMDVNLRLAASLEPRIDFLQTGVIFVNDPIVVEGDGLLLGGDEGQTVAVVSGCFTPYGQTGCTPVGPREVPVVPETPYDRTRGAFAFDPVIAGIQPGDFTGTVELKNVHGVMAGMLETESGPAGADYTVVPPKIFRFSPSSASLGQYVRIEGGGFVGARMGQTDLLTTVEFQGTFTPDGAGEGAEVSVILVPEFVSGPLVRYVVNEEDEVGQRIDLRKVSGTFVGNARPIVEKGIDSVTGDWTPVTLTIAPVKQVVFLNFQPAYVESLRHFGLRAVEGRIRQRVLEVCNRDYAGINVEFRTDPPDDFALYEQVDIAGPDPNGLGLLGYDNSPGKDVDNERLYDSIGGVNATTQQDGYPGYGGVFVESFFGFSKHPGGFADKLEGADEMFDDVFDSFRPDRDGTPVSATDLAQLPVVADGFECPAPDGGRPKRIACAIFVLGSMIGTTMTHEIGHSLGLANPYGEGFHNPGDQPNRLMDAGGSRTFTERAEMLGDGPARFCDDEYDYLREILPSPDGPNDILRPSCF